MPPQQQSPDDITDEICRHQGFMILEAGAGTGKTHNLTERVIHQLADRNVPLERMLTLTFTDFAAAEMRSRIYDAINKSIGKNGASEHLLDTRRRFSRNYISTFHSFCNRILHYFPDELTEISVSDRPDSLDPEGLRSQRNIDGAFELLGDYDEVLWMMEWRKRFYRIYKDHKGLQRQLSRISVSDFESFMHKLGGLDDQALHQMAALDCEQYLGKLRELTDIWRKEIDPQGNQLLSGLAEHPDWFKPETGPPETFEDLLELKTQSNGISLNELVKKNVDREIHAELNEIAKAFFPLYEAVRQAEAYLAADEVAEQLAAYSDEAEFNPDHEAYWNMRDLSELALRWKTLMRYQRFEAGYFNYDDMIWLTHKLLTENPGVTAQMRNRFDQILVDEFQDTDRRQWEIIRKLGFADDGNDKEVMIVGDIKQAIYSFRGGDVSMMRRVHADLKKRADRKSALPLRILPLPYSFRSNKTIVDFSNRVFRQVFGAGTTPASYEAHHQSLKRPSSEISKNADAPGEVRLLRADTAQLKKEIKQINEGKSTSSRTSVSVEAEALASDYVQLESRRIARFLREMRDGRHSQYEAVRQKMIRGERAVGVLYRRRKHMHALEQALAEAGLDYSVAKGTRYYQRREIKDAWLLLSFLLDAFDDVALVGLLRSPMISFSDSGLLAARVAMDKPGHDYPHFWNALSNAKHWDELLSDADRKALAAGIRLLEDLREMVPVKRVSEIVERAFFTDGPYLGAHADDAQVRENLIKLLDVIRNLERTGRGTLFEVTGFLSNRITEEAGDTEAEQPEPAPIQLMTVHGSKGLQFPMVAVPDMLAGDHDGGMQLFIADDDDDSAAWPAVSYKPPDKEGTDDSNTSFLHHFLKAERKKRRLAEAKRLFYVAVTRAETHLLVSMTDYSGSNKTGSFAEMLKPMFSDDEDQAGVSLTDDIVIQDFTVDDLEELSGYVPDPDPDDEEDADPDKARFTAADRSAAVFRRADQGVAADLQSASGISGKDRPQVEDADPDTGSDYKREKEDESGDAGTGLAPNDKGTLIHRALEFGFFEHGDTDTTPADKETDQAVQFWIRELSGMQYEHPEKVIEEHRDELIRHCRNASHCIRSMFGDQAPRRYEVAFEVLLRDEDRTGPESAGTRADAASPADDTSLADEASPADDTSQEDEASQVNEASHVDEVSPAAYRGYIDMIIRDSDGREHIVDFKTGPYTDNNRDYGYDRQIAVYKRAFEEIRQEKMDPGRVWLLFTDPEGGQAVSLADM
ncbi:UvrD-helicase domain-containing protein [Natronogracilivirga saccharolytica]|uniref:DNA 3'-5' helicase n=1 Tax=Natronogracilivirga saccharolytica TaxID=2812953 RepID=A0A8J7RK76_9BACT|nr:UvrD-helicase domain-containing protein [Natronogracilivirga saccharolytica]MBP3192757.1 UvrD-helicase domain-containing protein [Natronogracilivirga saccharolytica]